MRGDDDDDDKDYEDDEDSRIALMSDIGSNEKIAVGRIGSKGSINGIIHDEKEGGGRRVDGGRRTMEYHGCDGDIIMEGKEAGLELEDKSVMYAYDRDDCLRRCGEGGNASGEGKHDGDDGDKADDSDDVKNDEEEGDDGHSTEGNDKKINDGDNGGERINRPKQQQKEQQQQHCRCPPASVYRRRHRSKPSSLSSFLSLGDLQYMSDPKSTMYALFSFLGLSNSPVDAMGRYGFDPSVFLPYPPDPTPTPALVRPAAAADGSASDAGAGAGSGADTTTTTDTTSVAADTCDQDECAREVSSQGEGGGGKRLRKQQQHQQQQKHQQEKEQQEKKRKLQKARKIYVSVLRALESLLCPDRPDLVRRVILRVKDSDYDGARYSTNGRCGNASTTSEDDESSGDKTSASSSNSKRKRKRKENENEIPTAAALAVRAILKKEAGHEKLSANTIRLALVGDATSSTVASSLLAGSYRQSDLRDMLADASAGGVVEWNERYERNSTTKTTKKTTKKTMKTGSGVDGGRDDHGDDENNEEEADADDDDEDDDKDDDDGNCNEDGNIGDGDDEEDKEREEKKENIPFNPGTKQIRRTESGGDTKRPPTTTTKKKDQAYADADSEERCRWSSSSSSKVMEKSTNTNPKHKPKKGKSSCTASSSPARVAAVVSVPPRRRGMGDMRFATLRKTHSLLQMGRPLPKRAYSYRVRPESIMTAVAFLRRRLDMDVAFLGEGGGGRRRGRGGGAVDAEGANEIGIGNGTGGLDGAAFDTTAADSTTTTTTTLRDLEESLAGGRDRDSYGNGGGGGGGDNGDGYGNDRDVHFPPPPLPLDRCERRGRRGPNALTMMSSSSNSALNLSLERLFGEYRAACEATGMGQWRVGMPTFAEVFDSVVAGRGGIEGIGTGRGMGTGTAGTRTRKITRRRRLGRPRKGAVAMTTTNTTAAAAAAVTTAMAASAAGGDDATAAAADKTIADKMTVVDLAPVPLPFASPPPSPFPSTSSPPLEFPMPQQLQMPQQQQLLHWMQPQCVAVAAATGMDWTGGIIEVEAIGPTNTGMDTIRAGTETETEIDYRFGTAVGNVDGGGGSCVMGGSVSQQQQQQHHHVGLITHDLFGEP